jgi:hypothetical protein
MELNDNLKSIEEAKQSFLENFKDAYGIVSCEVCYSSFSPPRLSVCVNKPFETILGEEIKHQEYMGYPVIMYQQNSQLIAYGEPRNINWTTFPTFINIAENTPEYYLIKYLLGFVVPNDKNSLFEETRSNLANLFGWNDEDLREPAYYDKLKKMISKIDVDAKLFSEVYESENQKNNP